MPTNLIRPNLKAPDSAPASPRVAGPERIAILKAGRVTLRLRLLDTRTADLIWSALPLFGIVETWGDSIHFDTPLRTGRERTARLNARAGDVCFWSEDERVVIPWGPTPISRPDEIRLMRPCNIWAEIIDDPAALKIVTPGEKVSLSREAKA